MFFSISKILIFHLSSKEFRVKLPPLGTICGKKETDSSTHVLLDTIAWTAHAAFYWDWMTGGPTRGKFLKRTYLLVGLLLTYRSLQTHANHENPRRGRGKGSWYIGNRSPAKISAARIQPLQFSSFLNHY